MRFRQFIAFLALILIPLSIGVYLPHATQWSRNVTGLAFQPLLEITHAVSSWTIAQKNFLQMMFRLKQENERLVEKVRGLERELAGLEETKQENSRLRKLLSFQQVSSWKTISAQVIARDISQWTHYAMINKGSRDGIGQDMAVVTGEGLVGKVVGVTPHSARIILLIDAKSRVSALIQDTRDVGLIEGTGGAFLKLTYLDVSTQIQVGQKIISSGFGGVYPKGIPIGEIVQIGEESGDPNVHAIVKPFAALSKLEEVLCLDTEKTVSAKKKGK